MTEGTEDCASSSVSAADVSVVSAPIVVQEADGMLSCRVAAEDGGDVTARSDSSAVGEKGAIMPNPVSVVKEAVCRADVGSVVLDHIGSRLMHPVAEVALEVSDRAYGWQRVCSSNSAWRHDLLVMGTGVVCQRGTRR